MPVVAAQSTTSPNELRVQTALALLKDETKAVGDAVTTLRLRKTTEEGPGQLSLEVLSESPVGLSAAAFARIDFYQSGRDEAVGTFESLPASVSLPLAATTELPLQFEVRLTDVFEQQYTLAITISQQEEESAAAASQQIEQTLFIIPPTPKGPVSLSVLTGLLRAPKPAVGHEDMTLASLGTSEAVMHGWRGLGMGWSPPVLTGYCDQPARPDYADVLAHEFHDEPGTLVEKVKMLARLLKEAKHHVVYSGAGISTSSGISDYASRALDKNSASSQPRPKPRGFDAEPTYAHYVLTALQRAGLVAHWVNQNHDCLGEKAGFPMQHVNEIHGSWFDPSNPVVPMEGSLRGDLYAMMKHEEKAADMVLAVGSSLCGMNADRMVTTCGGKALEGEGIGSVIIGFQQTRLDEYACLRIFANIDQVLLLLGVELGLHVPLAKYVPDIPPDARTAREHVFRLPYDKKTGQRSSKHHCTLDLSPGARLKLTGGPGKGFQGEVLHTPNKEHDFYFLAFPVTREGPNLGKGIGHYALGAWWIEAAAKGNVDCLPCINLGKSETYTFMKA